MKRHTVWALVLATVCGGEAAAECATASLSMIHLKHPVPARPLLVLEATGTLAETDVASQLTLENGTERVPLVVLSSLFGAAAVQVVATPARRLRDGSWRLTARTGSAAARAVYGHPVGSITVATDASATPPRFVRAPRVAAFEATAFGCGSASQLRIVGAALDRPGLVHVRLKGDGFESVAIASATGDDPDVLVLGADPCGGALVLPQGAFFSVTLTPMSATGELGEWTTLFASTPPPVVRSSSSPFGLSEAFKALGGQAGR